MRFPFKLSSPQTRVIGPPRSGTNYAKFLLDNNSRLESGFHVGWWKHGVIPPLMTGKGAIRDMAFSIIMVRDLTSQVTSFWRFCQQGRGAVMSDAQDFAQFLRSPMHMRSFKGMTYYFDTPLSYLAQFYWAASEHKGEKTFIQLESIQAQPELLFETLRKTERFSTLGVPQNMVLPDGYMGRNADTELLGGSSYENETSVEKEKQQASKVTQSVTEADLAHIEASQAAQIIRDLPMFTRQHPA